jgi:glycosyltransferase involved in cell wall biosynthesis
MAPPVPVLIISDAPSSPTGLGRITREIATRADASLKDVCRIATLGYGGPGARGLNFFQYAIEGMGSDFVIPNLPEVWEDWAGKQAGVVLAIWDVSRLGWFSRPKIMCESETLKAFLGSAKFKRWTYTPVDADGPHERLAYPLVQSLLGFDRVLAYGKWAEGVIRRSLGEEAAQGRSLSSIPHGINEAVFYPRDRARSRMLFYSLTGATVLRPTTRMTAILDDEPLIGTVATNQARKDWGLWAEACALFLSRHPKARFWVHTDTLERHWSIPQLIIDFGLLDRVLISLGHLDDEQMAQAYSACDLTLGIGAGEGFGYPIAESLSCATPCIHGAYAGAVDYLNDTLLVKPVVFHREGLYACRRPVFNSQDWADRMDSLLGQRASRPGELSWTNVWPLFDTWFREGLRGLRF